MVKVVKVVKVVKEVKEVKMVSFITPILVSFMFSASVFADEYFGLSKQFFNSKNRNAKKYVLPTNFVVVKKDENGLFQLVDPELKNNQCIFKHINNWKLDYNWKFMFGKDFVPQDNLSSFKKLAYKAARVDTVIVLGEKSVAEDKTVEKLDVYTWGAEKPIFEYTNKEDFSVENGLKVLCNNLNYNGFVLDVTKGVVAVFSRAKNLDKTTQASVYRGQAKTALIRKNANLDASAILKYQRSAEDVHYFQKVIGNVSPWQKVYIQENEPAVPKD